MAAPFPCVVELFRNTQSATSSVPELQESDRRGAAPGVVRPLSSKTHSVTLSDVSSVATMSFGTNRNTIGRSGDRKSRKTQSTIVTAPSDVAMIADGVVAPSAGRTLSPLTRAFRDAAGIEIRKVPPARSVTNTVSSGPSPTRFRSERLIGPSDKESYSPSARKQVPPTAERLTPSLTSTNASTPKISPLTSFASPGFQVTTSPRSNSPAGPLSVVITKSTA